MLNQQHQSTPEQILQCGRTYYTAKKGHYRFEILLSWRGSCAQCLYHWYMPKKHSCQTQDTRFPSRTLPPACLFPIVHHGAIFIGICSIMHTWLVHMIWKHDLLDQATSLLTCLDLMLTCPFLAISKVGRNQLKFFYSYWKLFKKSYPFDIQYLPSIWLLPCEALDSW